MGFPARNKGKVVLSGNYISTVDHYYQTSNFAQTDTADETKFNGVTSSILFERNTLNRKQYASQGTFFSVRARYAKGNEYTIPGTTSVDTMLTKNLREWFQLRMVYDNYYKRKGHIKLGFYMESLFSSQPFFGNYTSTVLSAPAFQPVQEMQTLFLGDFHAHNFIGAGLRNVINISGNLDWRIEGYVFQAFQSIERTADLKAKYGDAFVKQFYIGSTGAVYHSPIGPVSLFVNYYHERTNPFSVLFHVGYILFNKSALE
jgi:NTE family protein